MSRLQAVHKNLNCQEINSNCQDKVLDFPESPGEQHSSVWHLPCQLEQKARTGTHTTVLALVHIWNTRSLHRWRNSERVATTFPSFASTRKHWTYFVRWNSKQRSSVATYQSWSPCMSLERLKKTFFWLQHHSVSDEQNREPVCCPPKANVSAADAQLLWIRGLLFANESTNLPVSAFCVRCVNKLTATFWHDLHVYYLDKILSTTNNVKGANKKFCHSRRQLSSLLMVAVAAI